MQKNCYGRFTTLALKTLSELDMHAFVPLNCLFLFVVSLCKSDLFISCSSETMEKFTGKKTLFDLEKQHYLQHF